MSESKSLEALVANGLSLLWKRNQDLQTEVDQLTKIVEVQQEALKRVSNFIELVEARRESKRERACKCDSI